MSVCPKLCRAASAYLGPLVLIGIGIGFAVVGAIPVCVTFLKNNMTSATIIGVGFIGFGLLLVIPGLLWCFVRRTSSSRCCQHRQLLVSTESNDNHDNQPPIMKKQPATCFGRIDLDGPETINIHDIDDDFNQQDEGDITGLTR